MYGAVEQRFALPLVGSRTATVTSCPQSNPLAEFQAVVRLVPAVFGALGMRREGNTTHTGVGRVRLHPAQVGPVRFKGGGRLGSVHLGKELLERGFNQEMAQGRDSAYGFGSMLPFNTAA